MKMCTVMLSEGVMYIFAASALESASTLKMQCLAVLTALLSDDINDVVCHGGSAMYRA